ncbi:MAG: NAD(P)-dependent dehydrogenase (short-subunit alcohol dehydrogenase family) [Cryomorphaceae bacterium]|jgi:NAD(P)-dependent dehydrogenase (short-subunit alcohol dehydrogenase family)
MNKSILITGANSGLGKDTARQLGLIKETEKIYLACRNELKAKAAKADLEKTTGRSIFEIIIMDVSNPDSVRLAVAELTEPIDALIMNAGGMGGNSPMDVTSDGVTALFAANLLGHVVLMDALLKEKKLTKVALYAGSEGARGVEDMGMNRPALKTSSEDEFTKVIDGTFFDKKTDPMEAYGYIKYVAALWMSSEARKNPNLRLITMSPGFTSGTAVMNDLPFAKRLMFKYIMLPIVAPLKGLVHKLEKGAKRFVDGIGDDSFKSGIFYASKPKRLTGQVIDQSTIFPDLNNSSYQDNANGAIHRFIK